MKTVKSDNPRREYIRLLSERANLAAAAHSDEHRDAILYSELIDKGYLRGTAVRDASKGGMTVGAAVTEITLEGRLFLQRLKDEERQKSLPGRIKSGWLMFGSVIIAFSGWALGILTPLLQERIKERIHPDVQQHDKATGAAKLTNQKPGQAPADIQSSPTVKPVP